MRILAKVVEKRSGCVVQAETRVAEHCLLTAKAWSSCTSVGGYVQADARGEIVVAPGHEHAGT